MAVRDLGDEPTSARRPTVEPGHVGLNISREGSTRF
jgi:hypothetical protein